MSRLLYSIPVEKTKESSFCIKSESGLDGLLAPVFFLTGRIHTCTQLVFQDNQRIFSFVVIISEIIELLHEKSEVEKLQSV